MAGAENPIPIQKRGTHVQEALRGMGQIALGRFRYSHVPERELNTIYKQAAERSGGRITRAVDSGTEVPEVTVYYRPRRLLGGFVTQEFDYAVDDLRRQRNSR